MTIQYGLLIDWIECLKALRQSDLTQIRSTLGSRGFGQVGTRLGSGHDLAIDDKLVLLSGRHVPHRLISTAGEQQDSAQYYSGPTHELAAILHRLLLCCGVSLCIESTDPATCQSNRSNVCPRS